MNPATTISVVVPFYNEAGNVFPLVEAVRSALGPGGGWELLLIDDGSTDTTPEEIEEAGRRDPRVRVIRLGRNYGQTAALQVGFDRARGDVVVTMDGDLQNDPADIPALVDALEDGHDLVTGYRKNRQDHLLTRKVPSWVANRLIRQLTGVPIRDNGCSLKAYRRELVERLHLYSDLHRFIPAVAVATAGARVAEIPVRHHARRVGSSKYGLSRTWKVLSDLLVITTIRSFRDRPLILFGAAGLWAFLVAGVFGALSLTPALVSGENAIVLPSITALMVGLGVYLVMLGLVAESAVFHARRRIDVSSLLVHPTRSGRRGEQRA
ncbi:MAG: glycosyltransferase [Gemmatimonadales bacterium]|nr:MAG: glycosyltransferase [Gemmatimonadales bacterium]